MSFMRKPNLQGRNDTATRKQYPNQGRWLSPDPAGLAAVNPSSPQSWNRYSYVENSPMGATDPTGLCDVVSGGFGQNPGTPGTAAPAMDFSLCRVKTSPPSAEPDAGGSRVRSAAFTSTVSGL